MNPEQVVAVAQTARQQRWLQALVHRAWPGTTVVGAAPGAQVQGIADVPGVLILLDCDVEGHAPSMIELQSWRQQVPLANLVALSGALHQRVLTRVLDTGACSYLLKTQPVTDLCAQLACAAAGEITHAPAVWRELLGRLRKPGASLAALTPRERDVLAAVGAGLSNAQTAQLLGLRPSTVAGYVKQVYRKLGIANRAQAARVARRLNGAGNVLRSP